MPYRGNMRIVNHRLLAGCATALLATFALAGCVPTPTPTPSTSAATDAPVFASDEEALAAATEAYAGFLMMSDQILKDGGSNPERIREYASDELAMVEMKGYTDTQTKGLRSTGGSQFSNITIQAIDETQGNKLAVVTVYLCSDVSAVDVIDASGTSVVSPNRPDRTPFEVTFDLVSTDPMRLLVASADVWGGPGVC